jgi:hypothetical protein
MQPHELRVVEELRDLRLRRNKLDSFIETPTFEGLPADERNRLIRQFAIMTEYAKVLQERVDNFGTANGIPTAQEPTPEAK